MPDEKPIRYVPPQAINIAVYTRNVQAVERIRLVLQRPEYTKGTLSSVISQLLPRIAEKLEEHSEAGATDRHIDIEARIMI